MASNLLITMTCAGHLLIDTKSYNALILEIVIVLSQISFAVETQIRSQPLKKEKWIAYLIPKLLQFEDSSMNKKIKKVLIVFIGQIWITWSCHWYRNDTKIWEWSFSVLFLLSIFMFLSPGFHHKLQPKIKLII